MTFHVTSPNVTGENVVRVAPAGLELDNRPIEWRAEGVVTGAEVADLNVDGSPEVYVYVRGPGEEARGSLVAWAANRRKSLSMISLPALAAEASVGYRGHDEFAVVESVLGRRFPIFDASGERTGRMRQLQYELVPGEAGWQLRVERTVEF